MISFEEMEVEIYCLKMEVLVVNLSSSSQEGYNSRNFCEKGEDALNHSVCYNCYRGDDALKHSVDTSNVSNLKVYNLKY